MRSIYPALIVASIFVHIYLLYSGVSFEDGQAYLSALRNSPSVKIDEHDLLLEDLPVAPVVPETRRGGEGCTICGATPRLCEEIGEDRLNKALVYPGSGDRIRRLLARIRDGVPFTMGVIGGSVSLGHGIDTGPDGSDPRHPKYRPQNMHRIIFEHLHALSPLSLGDDVPFDPLNTEGMVGSATGENSLFDVVGGKQQGKNVLVNGAQGGTGSGYFAYCWGEHVDRDSDLFVIELAINDEPLMKNFESYELMIRSIMDLPQKPAVISIEVFALMFNTIALGGDIHKSINQFYDVPSVSLRNSFLPQVMSNVSLVEDLFRRENGQPGSIEGIDLRHLSHLGHRISANLVNAYIDTQLCEMDRRSLLAEETHALGSIDEQYPISDIPKMRLNKMYHPENVVPTLEPQCFTMKNTRGPKLEPVEQEGWRTWSHGAKNYWISDTVGSTITFKFFTALGQVQLHYLRSKIFGLGNVLCWVDDAKDRAQRIEGWWHLEVNIDQSTAFDNLEPGDHLLHCEIEGHTADPGGKHEFRITSLTSI